MDTPFRNDVDALKTRLASLDEELDALRARAREYEATRERLAQVEREHADLRREIDARSTRRPVPFLDTLRIASPCHESWDNMIGDERTRFCARCQKNVHNISEMTRDEAETFLEANAGAACVRMYRRTDGTILTADCPVGVRKKRVRRLFLATIGGGLAAAAGALAIWRYEEATVMGEIEVAGKPAVPYFAEPPHVGQAMGTATASAPPAPTFATPPDREHAVMGAPRSPVPAPQPAPRHPQNDLEF